MYNYITGIDTGSEISHFVTIDVELTHIISNYSFMNKDLLMFVKQLNFPILTNSHIAIEQSTSTKQKVGKAVFDNTIYQGVLKGYIDCSYHEAEFITRKKVLGTLLHNAATKNADTAIRKYLSERIGIKGTAKNKGVCYGLHDDQWQALAVAVAYKDLFLKGV